jgi:hypothetical protein
MRRCPAAEIRTGRSSSRSSGGLEPQPTPAAHRPVGLRAYGRRVTSSRISAPRPPALISNIEPSPRSQGHPRVGTDSSHDHGPDPAPQADGRAGAEAGVANGGEFDGTGLALPGAPGESSGLAWRRCSRSPGAARPPRPGVAAGRRSGGRLDPPLTLVLDEVPLICPVALERWSADSGAGIVLHHGGAVAGAVDVEVGERSH